MQFALAPALLASDPASTTVQKLLAQGDTLPGSGAVVSNNPYAVHYVPGGWALETLTIAGSETIESTTGAWIKEGDAFAPGLTVGSLARSFDVDTSGRLAVIADLEDALGLGGYAVVLDGQAVLSVGDAALPSVDPQRAWVEFDIVRFDPAGRLIVAGFTDVLFQPSTLEYLAARYVVAGDGTLSSPVSLLRTGDVIEGRYVNHIVSIYDQQLAVRADGGGFAQVGLSDTPDGPWQPAIILGDQVLVTNGDLAPSAVGPGTVYGIIPGNPVDLNEAGDVAFLTSLFQGPSGWRGLVKNGALIAEEGQPAPGLPGTTLVTVLGPHLADDGRVLWFGTWTDALGAFQRGIFVDQTLWLHEGVTPLEGDPDWSFAGPLWQFDISPDGSRVLFQTQGLGPDWGIFEATLDQWVDLGGGLAGSGGTPSASGTGVLDAGATVSVDLSAATPNAQAWLVLGLSRLDAPLLGGVLCPSPDIVFANLPLDAAGAVSVSGTWPAGLPPGSDVWWQFWVLDPSGPFGVTASNCLEVQTL